MIKQVEAASHVAVGMVPPGSPCSYVPPEPMVRFEALAVIVPTVPPPDPSFFNKPLTVVRELVALYRPPPPTAVRIRLPSISIVLLVPVNAIVMADVPVPLRVRLLPDPMEFPEESIVTVLAPPDAVKDTAAEFVMVSELMVSPGVLRSIVAFISMTTLWLAVGTALSDQLAAVFQLLSLDPSQVLVWAYALSHCSRKAVAMSKAYKKRVPVAFTHE